MRSYKGYYTLIKKILLTSILLSSIFASALAQTPFSGTVRTTNPSYVGPGDLVAFTVWYGLRGYSAAAATTGTTKAVRFRNGVTNELCDVLIATTGGLGLTANCTGAHAGLSASAFCALSGGGCRVQTWYDQVGGNACAGATCNLVQNTTGAQLATGSFSSLANSYIFTPAGSTNITSANNFTPISPLSISIAANRNSSNPTATRILAAAGTTDGILAGTVVNQWILRGSVGSDLTVTVTDGVFHAGNGVITGAGSLIMIDGVDSSTASITLSTAAAAPNSTIAATGSVFFIHEGGFVNNHGFTSGERSSLNSNQRAYWGF